MIGQTIGRYRIVSRLGVGAMGEVYRARDERLGRDVAIKVLPAEWLADSDRRARLDREARILASLNHVHIGSIYGVEEGGHVLALVLEIVEGPTLADRIAQRPLSVDDGLEVARQIADALAIAPTPISCL